MLDGRCLPGNSTNTCVDRAKQRGELQQFSGEFRPFQLPLPLYVIPGLLNIVEVWILEGAGGGVE